MKDHAQPSLARPRAYALLAVLAPALGGSTGLWSRGVLLLATAVVLMMWPPRRAPGALWAALALALTLFAGAAFLPAQWFSPPVWRQMLTLTFEVPLPETATPQPWLTAEGAGLFVSALAFALSLVAHPWEHHHERHSATRSYTLGILGLAGLALASAAAKWPVPWWPKPLNSGIEFGFFPNRNQTANVLALGGIMTAALGFDALSRRRKVGYGWLAGLALVAAALVAAFSRAGIALFFGGTAAWVVLGLRSTGSKKGGMLALAAVLVLLAGFFLYGGETLKRFQSGTGVTAGDYRVGIQREAWELAAQRPWLGQGLGNFAPIYALIRTDRAKQNQVLHPESDWLWAAVELGWPAVALLAAALALWLAQTLPFAAGTDRHLRSAAAICGAGFALHGLVDVSAHRAGALWPALLLFSLARDPRRAGPETPWAAPVFRLGALLLAALGAWWVTSAVAPERTRHFPTSANLAWLDARAERENAAADYPALKSTADEALRIAPLAWEFYYRRAVAHAATPEHLQDAATDFDRARFLNPRSAEICLNEGRIWLALHQPEQTIESWVEALRRAGPEAPPFFVQMLALGWSKLDVRAGLARIAESGPEFFLPYLEWAQGLEFTLAATRFLERDPTLATLSHPQRQRFFNAWFRNGDREQLVAIAVAHPDWQEDAWLGLARHYAEKKDFARAWSFVERYNTPPVLPHLVPAQSLAELEREFHLHPENFQAGLGLYTALRHLRQNDEALTTLQAVNAIPGRPDYVAYVLAALLAEKGDWEHAWAAWESYARAVKIL